MACTVIGNWREEHPKQDMRKKYALYRWWNWNLNLRRHNNDALNPSSLYDSNYCSDVQEPRLQLHEYSSNWFRTLWWKAFIAITKNKKFVKELAMKLSKKRHKYLSMIPFPSPYPGKSGTHGRHKLESGYIYPIELLTGESWHRFRPIILSP